MVKSELIELMAAKADITTAQAEDVVNMFFNTIVESVTTEGRVEIRGFGAFTVRKYKAYDGRNPKTGERIEVPEKKLPFWKTGLELRQRVDGLGAGSRD
ncbi:MAG: integration host factor subunit beta [Silvanigrellales bacterium]|jgi:integration host factor subunit beta|nr:integration host factor subunit beta [Silvanigrellales bacterium]